MIIYEIGVLGETHLFKEYLDACVDLSEPRPGINAGSIILSQSHKINFYFLDDFNAKIDKELQLVYPYLLGIIGVFDWQSDISFGYLQELLLNIQKTTVYPMLYHATNLPGVLPFSRKRIKNGVVLDYGNFLYLDQTGNAKGVRNSLQKLISLATIQNEKIKTKNN